MKKSVNFRRRPKSPTAADLLATFRRLGMSDDEIAKTLQEAKAAEQQRAVDALPCGHTAGVEFGMSSWSCVVCGQTARR